MSTQSMYPTDEKSWWRRPAGGREVMVVAMPLVVSSLSWTIMTYVDRIFLNMLSGTSMAAAFSASVVWFAILCFPLGICSYTNTFVSQYFGDRQLARIGPSMWQGVWTALAFSPVMLACIPLAPMMFQLAKHGPEATAQEVLYFQILCVGAPALLVGQSMSSLYSGRGETWVVMIVDATVTVVNLVLDYLWIFGYAGFPEGGIAGAGWATVVSLWLKVAVYLVLILQRKHQLQFNTLSGIRFDRKLFGRLLYFGGPCGVQMLLDVSGFTVFVVLVGRLGAMESEAMTLAFSVNMVAFMPIFGFGMAVAILVGQHLGENRDDLAARATKTSLQISLAYMALICALYIFTPGLFLHSFFAGNGPMTADKIALREMAANLLLFVAAYSFLDAVQMIYVSALKGAGDTRFVLWASLVLASLFVVCSWLSVEVLKLNVYGCWTTVTVWICLMGVTYLLRFLQGGWRKMRVIEQQHQPTEQIRPGSEMLDGDPAIESVATEIS